MLQLPAGHGAQMLGLHTPVTLSVDDLSGAALLSLGCSRLVCGALQVEAVEPLPGAFGE